jgi:peptide/nickel transport system permease protein
MTETAGLGPLDQPGSAFPMPDVDELGEATATLQTVGIEVQESYFQLIWRRFRKSKIAILGGLMVIALSLLAVFADFFSPNPLRELNMEASFTPPTRIHFVDSEGNFHLRPFVYTQVVTIDMTTFAPTWEEDTSVMYPIQFFPKGWEYEILGLIPANRHLFGVEAPGRIYLLGTDRIGRDLWGKSCEAGRISLSMALFGTLISVAIGSVVGISSGYYGGRTDTIMQRGVEFVNAFPQLPLWMALAAIIPRTWDSLKIFIIMSIIFAMLSWTTLAREVRGKVLSYRESDFVLAAKEMGASDSRIIFRHLYPNMLSHIIVVLTLTIPGIILAEAFLSFLGIGIQEPLTSWGLLMRQAQTIDVLGEYTWMMTPVLFIITAVLGFNFLGDGLRDAADPYATM